MTNGYDYGLADYASNSRDSDGDGIPDGSDAYPFDAFNGGTPGVLLVDGANQVAGPAQFLPAAFASRVTFNDLSAPGGPVTFSIVNRDGFLGAREKSHS